MSDLSHAEKTHGQLDRDEYSVVTLLEILAKQKALILGVTLGGTALAAAVAMLAPRYYSASTLLLPPQQNQSAAVGALAQLGSLAGLAGASAGVKSADETYVAFLKTRRVQDALIKKHKLIQRYEVKSEESARDVLSTLVSVSSDKKSGLITIAVEDRDPEFAATMANSYVNELQRMLGQFAVTEAQQRRMFLEQQVAKARDLLQTAEAVFRKEQIHGGMLVTQALAEDSVRGSLELRRQIAIEEVAIQALGMTVTPKHPDLQRMNAHLAALQTQLMRLEQGVGGAAANDDKVGVSAAVNAFRTMKVQEAALDALVRQYELAKLDEARDGPVLQQVDVAVAPETAARPKRKAIVVGGAAVSLLVGMLIATIRGIRSRRTL
jgi:tyrosine-protein kinase Etk/Wzc